MDTSNKPKFDLLNFILHHNLSAWLIPALIGGFVGYNTVYAEYVNYKRDRAEFYSNKQVYDAYGAKIIQLEQKCQVGEEAKRILDMTNIKGVSTGSAIIKVRPTNTPTRTPTPNIQGRDTDYVYSGLISEKN